MHLIILNGIKQIFVTGGSEATVLQPGIGGFNAMMAYLQETMILKQHQDHLTKMGMVL